jgi:hypothetical protein
MSLYDVLPEDLKREVGRFLHWLYFTVVLDELKLMTVPLFFELNKNISSYPHLITISRWDSEYDPLDDATNWNVPRWNLFELDGRMCNCNMNREKFCCEGEMQSLP